jgi:hypothetical protein
MLPCDSYPAACPDPNPLPVDDRIDVFFESPSGTVLEGAGGDTIFFDVFVKMCNAVEIVSWSLSLRTTNCSVASVSRVNTVLDSPSPPAIPVDDQTVDGAASVAYFDPLAGRSLHARAAATVQTL